MFDLIVTGPDSEKIAIECVRATDPRMREIGSMVKRGVPMDPYALVLDWSVRFNLNLNINGTRETLPYLLQRLESCGVHSTHIVGVSEVVERIFDEMYELGIESADAFRPSSGGNIQMLPVGIGGCVNEMGTDVPEWAEEFLSAPARSDVLAKLENADGFLHREVFIECDMYGVPWHVADYLCQQSPFLPDIQPKLPKPLTGVWLGYGPFGVRWNSRGWVAFDARRTVIRSKPSTDGPR